jgi:phosphoribosyl 1,2-cyclic phosphodiesterase
MVFLAGSIHEEPGASIVEGAEEIEFSETWKIPFRALLINRFAPQIKIKLHGDKEQAFEMLKILNPKNVGLFHQSAYKLDEVAEEIKHSFDFVEKVSILKEKELVILN